MRLIHTARFEKDYSAAPTDVQRAFDKQERFLADNLQHPSLHAKKYDESTGLWQARVNRSWRFLFHHRRGTPTSSTPSSRTKSRAGSSFGGRKHELGLGSVLGRGQCIAGMLH